MTSHTFEGETVVFPDYKGQDYLWVQKKLPGGKAPDFTGTNPAKVRKCFSEERCGACGLVVPGKTYFFVTAASVLRGRAAPFDARGPLDRDVDGPTIHLTEPPLHRVCARLAVMLCPVLREQRDGVPAIIEVPKGLLVFYPHGLGFVRGGHYPQRVLSAWTAKPLAKNMTGA